MSAIRGFHDVRIKLADFNKDAVELAAERHRRVSPPHDEPD